MAMTLVERAGSPTVVGGTNPYRLYSYWLYATESEDENAVEAYVLANTPATSNGIPRLHVECENVPAAVSAQGKPWAVEVRYQQPGGSGVSTPGGPAGIRIGMGGTTQRVYRSLETVASYKLSGAADRDFGGLIGVTKDGVDGVEVGASTYRATRYIFKDEGDWDQAFEQFLFSYANAVNSDTWQGFAPGEVRIIDINANHNPTEGRYEVAITYEAIANEEDVELGDGLTIDDKRGHDYLWLYMVEAEDAAGFVTRTPVYANVERVYEYLPFASLFT